MTRILEGDLYAKTAYTVAKRGVGRAMLQGRSWREAVQEAEVQISRETAYRLWQRMWAHRENDIGERRQGQPTKVCGAVRAWLEGYYQQHPRAPGKAVQALLEAHCGVRISVTHLKSGAGGAHRSDLRGEKAT